MTTVIRQAELVTREGYERLRAELDQLVRHRRPQVADELRDARADGSEPGENVGLVALLDDQAAVERRIDDLGATLARVRIAEPPADGVAGIGQRLRIRLAEGARPLDCTLVGALEAEPSSGGISIESPIGSALVGRRAGDVVEVETPGGTRVVELLAIGPS